MSANDGLVPKMPATSSAVSNPAFSALKRNNPAGNRTPFIGVEPTRRHGSSVPYRVYEISVPGGSVSSVTVLEIRSHSAARSGSPGSHASACLARSTAAMKSCRSARRVISGSAVYFAHRSFATLVPKFVAPATTATSATAAGIATIGRRSTRQRDGVARVAVFSRNFAIV